MNIFTIFYISVIWIIYISSMPFLWFYSRKEKYKESLPARFFLKKNSSLEESGIWFHGCSFGEIKALAPFVEALDRDKLRFSTTTKTGYEEALKYTNQTRYLPFEALLFKWLTPQKVLVVMEAEFWYLMFYFSKLKGSKNILINARMSEKSYPKYLQYRWFYRKVFQNIDSIYAQTQEDKIRLESLGAKNIKVIGNIKFHTIQKPTKILDKPDALLVCAGSTHDKEESLILEAFRELKINKPNAKLVIAPRHPERFAKVDRIIGYYCELQKWSYKKYSISRTLSADITLIDSLGELINLYAISDIVVLGGAFEPIGGHNASEPAQFGCSIISGEHYFNQKDIFAGVEGIKIVKNSELKDVLKYPKLLPKTKITTKTDITPILEEIKETLR